MCVHAGRPLSARLHRGTTRTPVHRHPAGVRRTFLHPPRILRLRVWFRPIACGAHSSGWNERISGPPRLCDFGRGGLFLVWGSKPCAMLLPPGAPRRRRSGAGCDAVCGAQTLPRDPPCSPHAALPPAAGSANAMTIGSPESVVISGGRAAGRAGATGIAHRAGRWLGR